MYYSSRNSTRYSQEGRCNNRLRLGRYSWRTWCASSTSCTFVTFQQTYKSYSFSKSHPLRLHQTKSYFPYPSRYLCPTMSRMIHFWPVTHRTILSRFLLTKLIDFIFHRTQMWLALKDVADLFFYLSNLVDDLSTSLGGNRCHQIPFLHHFVGYCTEEFIALRYIRRNLWTLYEHKRKGVIHFDTDYSAQVVVNLQSLDMKYFTNWFLDCDQIVISLKKIEQWAEISQAYKGLLFHNSFYLFLKLLVVIFIFFWCSSFHNV